MMRALLALLIVFGCTLLIVPTAVSGPIEPEAAPTEIDVVASNEAAPDPYFGLGDLNTRAVPVVSCFNGDTACEEIPLGSNCWSNPLCKCVAFATCRIP